jgi:hypothetical protein
MPMDPCQLSTTTDSTTIHKNLNITNNNLVSHIEIFTDIESSRTDIPNSSLKLNLNDEYGLNYSDSENIENNDVNTLIDSQFSELSDDPIEQLLMTSTFSNYNDFNDSIDLKFPQEQFDDYPQIYQLFSNKSFATDYDSLYPSNDLTDCDSLHDYSSISNIIYTNKMKEKLRKKRHSSTDLTLSSPTNKQSQSKITKSNFSNSNNNSSLSLSLNRNHKLRSKSLGALSLSTNPALMSMKTDHSSRYINSASPTSRATNPFYQPPAILKRLSNSGL